MKTLLCGIECYLLKINLCDECGFSGCVMMLIKLINEGTVAQQRGRVNVDRSEKCE